jgi:cyclopropane-fatty-acyl-phospholipid synthase
MSPSVPLSTENAIQPGPTERTSDTIVPVNPTPVANNEFRAPGWFDRVLRHGVHRQFDKLRSGFLFIQEDGSESRFGRSDDDGLTAAMAVHSPDFYRRAAFGGALGFAESYFLGEWTTDCLTDVVRVFCRNLNICDTTNRSLLRYGLRLGRRWHQRHNNSKENSLKNIHAHYDLGNDFYSLFLDETMTYSCGVFDSPDTSLHAAQVAKIDRMCRKLDLQPSDHLVEIGTGWGAFAVHAARQYGCRVTTTTISREQHDFARKRIADAGLSDRITLQLKDYRDLDGQYDKLVSVEMIEAVGHEYFDTFFRKCGELLKPEGQMVIQGITMSEQRYPQYLRSVDFIQRYIFHGGCLITPGAVLQSVARTSDLRLLHLEDMAQHYARTLRTWRERFCQRIADVRLQGFPESFVRLWDYYLSYCEAAFTERLVGTVQMHFAGPRCDTDGLRPFV